MLEIILIFFMIFLILTFFYKQAICDFRINQIEWSQNDTISGLLIEKVPIVVRSIPSATFWTHNDVIHRACYKNIPIFKETSLVHWLSTSDVDSICPWKYEQAEMIASVSSINIWADRYMNYLFNSLINKYPARVNNDQASKILGFNPDEIRILVTYGHLKPIAKPKQNSHKYFTLVDLCEKAIDPEWITKSTGTVYKHWNTKNSNKLKPCDSE